MSRVCKCGHAENMHGVENNVLGMGRVCCWPIDERGRSKVKSGPIKQCRCKKWTPVVLVELIFGVEGPSLIVGGTRVAGPKPWGWRTAAYSFSVEIERARKAIGESK